MTSIARSTVYFFNGCRRGRETSLDRPATSLLEFDDGENDVAIGRTMSVDSDLGNLSGWEHNFARELRAVEERLSQRESAEDPYDTISALQEDIGVRETATDYECGHCRKTFEEEIQVTCEKWNGREDKSTSPHFKRMVQLDDDASTVQSTTTSSVFGDNSYDGGNCCGDRNRRGVSSRRAGGVKISP